MTGEYRQKWGFMYEFKFPVFILVGRVTADPQQPGGITVHDPALLTAPNAPNALAVFTDSVAAEKFREEHSTSHQVFTLDSLIVFETVLQGAKQVAGVVVFDPNRAEGPAMTAPIDDVLRGLTKRA